MARINTNVSSLTAQRGLARSQKTLDSTLQRLSSGLRINRGADDPAGLIASEGGATVTTLTGKAWFDMAHPSKSIGILAAAPTHHAGLKELLAHEHA